MNALLTRLLRAIGILLYSLRLHPIVIWLHRRQPKVLLYHACEEVENDFIRGLGSNTPPAAFAGHLAFLARYYTVIPLSRLESGDIPDRAVVITFDDGYRSAYENAFARLRERRMPAIIYLITDVVDNRALVWVNELNWLLRNHAAAVVPRATRMLGLGSDATPEAILDAAHAAFDPDAIRDWLADIRQAAGIDARRFAEESRLYVGWEEVRAMARERISFGNHTASHPNLARLDEAAQRREIGAAKAVLAARLSGNGGDYGGRSLSYPFGDHDERIQRVALELGAVSLMEVGGANRPLDLQHVARVPIGCLSTAEFFAELEVVEPVKAQLKRLLGGAI